MAILCWIFCIVTTAFALPGYHQDDYDVKFERAQIPWYDHNFMRDAYLGFPFYNRTTRMFNASAYLLQDMTTTDFVAEVQIYKFLSNEYRYFPITLSLNICVEYKNNNFHIQETLKNISNVKQCPLKKGLYYVYNFVPDYSTLPPFIPRGRYKSTSKLYYNKKFVAEFYVCAEIVDKPLKWSK